MRVATLFIRAREMPIGELAWWTLARVGVCYRVRGTELQNT